MTSRREGPVPLDHRRAPRPVGRRSDRRPRPGLQCEARRGSVGGRGPDAPPLLPPPRGNPGGPQDSGRAGRDLLARPDGHAGHGSRRSDVLRIGRACGGRRPVYSVRRCPDHPNEATTWRIASRSLPGSGTGETAWTLSGQHTGRTDLPMTDVASNASSLAGRLRGIDFAGLRQLPRPGAADERAGGLRGGWRRSSPSRCAEWATARPEGRGRRPRNRSNPRASVPAGPVPRSAPLARGESMADVRGFRPLSTQ